jgi:hypothetical protein
MKNKLVLLLATISLGASSLLGQSLADFNYGSVGALGGGLFLGADGGSADSIAIGYFSAAANAELTGWTAYQTDNTWNTTGMNVAAGTGFDVTSAVGKDAWILFSDASLTGLVRANDWASISGVASPGTPAALVYQFDSADTAANISSFAGAGTTLTITDNGGFQGNSGVGFQLTAVPEPSAYAALAGILALGCVMLRRRA